MDQQLEFARLLLPSGNGIPLRKPTHDIDVGDICYWSPEGKASRILNIFDNKQWLSNNNWPQLNVSRDEVIDISEDVKLDIVHGGGCWWGVTPSYTAPGFDIYFHRLATDLAIIVPSSPCKIHGLRPHGKRALEQWWNLALRYAFRTWDHLIDNPTGIFLVTKCLRTHRYAHALSKGTQGQAAQLHVHGAVTPGANPGEVNLPVQGTNWAFVKNELGFEVQDSGGAAEFTIFIEREATRMYRVSDVGIRDAAQRLWTTCTSAGAPAPAAPAPPQNPWLISSHPGWNAAPVNVPRPPPPPPAPARPPPGSAAAAAIFDGKDRLTLRNGWSLLRSNEGAFFLEQTTSSLELWNTQQLTTQSLLDILGAPPPPAAPPAVNPPQLPPNMPIPNGAPSQQGHPLPGSMPPMGMPMGIVNGQPIPMMGPNPIPMGGPMGAGPIGGPAPMGQFPPFAIPGVATISPPLGGFAGVPPGMMPAMMGSPQPIPGPKLPGEGGRIGLPQFGAGDSGGGAGGGGGGGGPVFRLPGMGVDVPFGWN